MTYSIQIYREGAGSWETLVMFDPVVFDEMVEAGRAMFINPLLSADNVAIVDDLTGAVFWDACSDDEDCEPADIDDDCGFDPYEGCFTYDC